MRLCGSIPRSAMADQLSCGLRGAPCPLSDLTSSDLNASQLAATNGPTSEFSTLSKSSVYDGLSGIVAQNPSRIPSDFPQQPPLYEPPSWAVPARGEARLEPVCEALGRQTSVDLTAKSAFRVGRSPQCDVQLHHGTSSRRHALLFHHSNGSCYIVDCGSAHGTYVNGVRITSPPKGGVVIPHKVRRGAMIRFGGPGAPCFVLKSFSFNLQELTSDDTNAVSVDDNASAVVQKNTRLNALGQTAMDSVRLSVLNTTSKRSFDSLEGVETVDEPCSKRQRLRCSSPPLSPQEPLRLVSPSSPPLANKRRVSFSDAPTHFFPITVTPPESDSDEDH